ncbi:MAG: ATP-binding protein [Cyanobacteria bacterium P01_C01_bin.69]
MKLASFRLRIALLSVALAGGALVGFGLVAWRLIYVAKVKSLEAKVDSQLRQMRPDSSTDWWQNFADNDLPRELETEIGTPINLLFTDSQGNTIHYSIDGAQLGTVALDIGSLLKDTAEEMVLKEAKTAKENPDNPISTKPVRRIFTPNTQAGNWLVGVIKTESGRGAIAVSLETIDQDMAIIRNIFLVAIPSTLLMIAAGAWVLSGSALKPVRKLTSVIKQVTATGLDQQVPVGSTDVEFVELIEVFNEMLTRLERSFRQSSRFSGDAAHELKTPLAILRGELELAMHQAKPGSDLQQSLSKLMDEVSRLSNIVRKLLLLSLADAGQMSLKKDTVDIEEILSVLIEDIELLAPNLAVHADIEKGLSVKGDRDLLTQVLQNLIDNAVKYNLPESSNQQWLSVTGKADKTKISITVANASDKIPAAECDRIFDRFYRGDLSRNRKREGFGLGLSLSREIAKAHRGNLYLDKHHSETPNTKTPHTKTPHTKTDTNSAQTAFTLVLPII